MLPALMVSPPVEALVYSTMPARWTARPELAMDGDEATAFRSFRGMERGDAFMVRLSRPVAARSIRVTTGDGGGANVFGGSLEVSTDGTTYRKAAEFDEKGVAETKGARGVVAIRLRASRSSILVVREIRIDAKESIAHALRGPGRGFVDLGGNGDLKAWAARAEAQMESFWAETDALLASDDFVPPNAVHVVYREGANLPPGSNGGGVMTVDANWCRKHPEDTGLTVHEMAHSVQSGGSPGWIVEAVADYVRWVKFEPQNFTFRIDPKSKPQSPYRPGAAFLGWCELRYDPKLVTKLYDAARFGRYRDSLFERYCGKSIDTLWAEFLAEYAKDPKGVLLPSVPPAQRPRALPAVGASSPVEIPYDTIGIAADGTKVRATGGFDGEGSTFSAAALGPMVRANGATFRLGPVGASNVLSSRGQAIRLSGTHKSVWILAAAIEGNQMDDSLGVAYADGTTVRFDQSFSDWYTPGEFPGEVRAVRMAYRLLADGSRDDRPFTVYAYGFPLDPAKPLASLTLPMNENIRVLAVSVGD